MQQDHICASFADLTHRLGSTGVECKGNGRFGFNTDVQSQGFFA